MINLIIVTHGELGAYFAETAEMIVGQQPEGVEILSISPRVSAEKAKKELLSTLKKTHSKEGTIIFTDILGGTPTNIAVPSSENMKDVAVISGVNLNMIVTAFSYRFKLPFAELVSKIISDGKKSICEVKKLLAKIQKKKHND
jgi:PTS system mannose-specific IIA component